MKYIIKENKAIIFINDNKYIIQNPSKEQIDAIISNNEEKIKNLLLKTSDNLTKEDISASKNLLIRGNCVYMKNVSDVSLPEDLVKKILIAEKHNDTKKIEKYKNFWTLVSMNPDARVRDNMFWFIRKWGMSISKAGFIIAYRNVDIIKKSNYNIKEVVDLYYKTKHIDNKDPNTVDYKGNTLENVFQSVIFGNFGDVYTDNHSHTFTIRLGQVVEMPREQCDSEQENSCSRGLHVGAKGWLKANYCGNVGLKVLVNPADVVAVPTIDNYGKMRCCSYMPVGIISFNKSGDVIDTAVTIEDEIKYINKIKEINNEDVNNYEIIKRTPEEIFKELRKLYNEKEHKC